MSLLLLFAGAPLAGNNGSLNATLANATLSANAQVIDSGSLSQTLASATLAATASIGQSNNGIVAETLGNATLSASATVAISAALDQILGDATLSSQGTAGLPLLGRVVVTNVAPESIGLSNAPNTYEVDTRIRLSATFTDALTGEAADPTGVNIFIRSAKGVTSESDLSSGVIRDDVGKYHFDVTVDSAGPWIYKFQGTGNIEVTSLDAYIFVKQTVFSPTP